nr:hypothetical protein [Kibdelosporangium sp. MJ126-NF4]CTQ90730.1 hypothetical protein [Kibdelosporangium sp. MJ126-NF4]
MLPDLLWLSTSHRWAGGVRHAITSLDRDKDIEILVLQHQIAVLQRQLGGSRVRFSPADRALFAAFLHRLPHRTLHRLLRWHRDLLGRRHARMSRPKRPGRPRNALIEAGFPYEQYLRDTARLAEILES